MLYKFYVIESVQHYFNVYDYLLEFLEITLDRANESYALIVYRCRIFPSSLILFLLMFLSDLSRKLIRSLLPLIFLPLNSASLACFAP